MNVFEGRAARDRGQVGHGGPKWRQVGPRLGDFQQSESRQDDVREKTTTILASLKLISVSPDNLKIGDTCKKNGK